MCAFSLKFYKFLIVHRFALKIVSRISSHKLRDPNDPYNARVWGVNEMLAAGGTLLADFNNRTVRLFEPETGALGKPLYKTASAERKVYTALAPNDDVVIIIESCDVSRWNGPLISNECVYSLVSVVSSSDNSWHFKSSAEFFRKSHEPKPQNALLRLAGRRLLCGVRRSRRLTAIECDAFGTLKKADVDFDSPLLDIATIENRGKKAC